MVILFSYTKDIERVCAAAMRSCYSRASAFQLYRNQLIKGEKTLTEDRIQELIRRTLKLGHESVLEHGLLTFDLQGVSRAMCYSEDTEVLTDSGWKNFSSVDIGSDRFATLNPRTQEVQYLKAAEKIVEQYKGKMVRIRSSVVDLLVTPNHRVYFFDYDKRSRSSRLWKLDRADSLIGRRFQLRTDGNWQVASKRFIRIPSVEVTSSNGKRRRYPSLQLPFDYYCSFLGYYLSEGHLHHARNSGYGIVITQRKDSPHYIDILETIRRVGFKPNFRQDARHPTTHYLRFFSIQLYHYLAGFGRHATEKRVDPQVKGASKKQIRRFLDAYIAGDGHIYPKNGHVYVFTSSRQIADDLQELALKVGLSAYVRVDNRVGSRHFSVKVGRYIGQTVPTFVVSLRQHQSLRPLVNHRPKADRNQVRFEDYHGPVYCVAVPPNELLYVRRNGRPVWCGNTHQLVRHRIASFSQQSQRHVRVDSSTDWYMTPPALDADSRRKFEERMKTVASWYAEDTKKGRRIEDARFYLPNATRTNITVSMNPRELLHVFRLRCSAAAQWEIRAVAWAMLACSRIVAPNIFETISHGKTDKYVEERETRLKRILSELQSRFEGAQLGETVQIPLADLDLGTNIEALISKC